MTDPTPHHSDDDEIVSAYLDGEASPEEIARVESDPVLAARLDTFASLLASVRDVPAPAPGLVDGHIDTALAAFTAVGDTPNDPTSNPSSAATDAPSGARTVAHDDGRSATVHAFTDRAERPAWTRLPLGAVAAAVVFVALIGVVMLAVNDDGRGDDMAATAEETAEDLSVDDSSQDAAATLDAPVAGGGSAVMAERLTFSDADALADYLRQQLAAREAPPASAPEPGDTGGGGGGGTAGSDGAGSTRTVEGAESAPANDAAPAADPDPCDVLSLLDLDPARVATIVSVVVEDRPATAVVHGPEDERRLVVVDDGTCQVTVDRLL